MAIITFTVTPGATAGAPLHFAPDSGPIDLICSAQEHRCRDFTLFAPATAGQTLIAQLNPFGDSDIVAVCAVRDEPQSASGKFQARKLQMQAPTIAGTVIMITFTDAGPGGDVPGDIFGHPNIRRRVFTIDVSGGGVPSISPANAQVQSHDLLIFERGNGTSGYDVQVRLTVGSEPAGSPAFVACAVGNPAGFVRVINLAPNRTTDSVIRFKKKGGGDPPDGWPDS